MTFDGLRELLNGPMPDSRPISGADIRAAATAMIERPYQPTPALVMHPDTARLVSRYIATSEIRWLLGRNARARAFGLTRAVRRERARELVRSLWARERSGS